MWPFAPLRFRCFTDSLWLIYESAVNLRLRHESGSDGGVIGASVLCCLGMQATRFARFSRLSIMCLAATPCLAGSGSEVRVQLSEDRGAAWGVTRLARCPCYPAARGGLRLFTGFISADVRLTVLQPIRLSVFYCDYSTVCPYSDRVYRPALSVLISFFQFVCPPPSSFCLYNYDGQSVCLRLSGYM